MRDPNALVALETGDDAAVYLVAPGVGLVQTVDFFSPLVDDPYTFGQIAAANALSDIYAMGGKPLFALNVAGFPSKTLPLSVLEAILRGGAEKAAEAGISILGGHTVEDPEPKYGLVVTGTVAPDKILRNKGARAGDVLVLTKPLGTGIIANAMKKGRASAEAEEAAIRSMTTLNRAAAEAAVGLEVHACTDVTGFGLLGHLVGMLNASAVSARIFGSRLPELPTARALCSAGVFPGGSARNSSYYGRQFVSEGMSEVEQQLAADAQTSGGLLFSMPETDARTLISRVAGAVIIGTVLAGVPGRVFGAQ